MPLKKIPKSQANNTGYVVYEPSNYDPAKKWPLVLFFHGDGQIGDGTDAGLQTIVDLIDSPWYPWMAQLKKDRFVMIAPQLQPGLGYWPLSYGDNALAFSDQYSIDQSRLYLTGLSRGGGIVFGYPSSSVEDGQKFAGILACCCISVGGNYSLVKSPLFAYHAKDDKQVPWTGTDSIVKAINASNPPVKAQAKFYDTGGHEIWGRVFGENEAWDWLLAQKKGSPIPINPPITPAPSTLKADASATQTNVVGTTAILDGSKSVGYKNSWYLGWKELSRPPGSTYDIWDMPNSGKSGEVVKLKNLVPGKYKFQLDAGDGNGNTAIDTVEITVSAAPTGAKIVGTSTVNGKNVNLLEDNTWVYS
jgi:predicted esterase